MTLEELAFYAFASLAVASSGFLLTEGRTPRSASIALGLLGFSVAGIFQSLGADLLAILGWLLSLASVLVSGLAEEEFSLASVGRVMVKLLGTVAAVCVAGVLIWIVKETGGGRVGEAALPDSQAIATSLYAGGVSPLQLLALLLLVALVGSVVLAKRRLG